MTELSTDPEMLHLMSQVAPALTTLDEAGAETLMDGVVVTLLLEQPHKYRNSVKENAVAFRTWKFITSSLCRMPCYLKRRIVLNCFVFPQLNRTT